MGKTGGNHDPRTVAAEDKRLRAIELRIAGKSFQAIGDELGVSDVMAGKYVRKAMARLAAEVTEKADELRQLELERLDRLFELALNDAQASDKPAFAIQAAVKIMDRRAKLLGLDAPARSEVMGPNGQPVVNLADLMGAAMAAGERSGEGED